MASAGKLGGCFASFLHKIPKNALDSAAGLIYTALDWLRGSGEKPEASAMSDPA